MSNDELQNIFSNSEKNSFKPETKTMHLNGRRTSLRVEEIYWESFHNICEIEEQSPKELLTEIDKIRGTTSMARALRLFTISYYRRTAPSAK